QAGRAARTSRRAHSADQELHDSSLRVAEQGARLDQLVVIGDRRQMTAGPSRPPGSCDPPAHSAHGPTAAPRLSPYQRTAGPRRGPGAWAPCGRRGPAAAARRRAAPPSSRPPRRVVPVACDLPLPPSWRTTMSAETPDLAIAQQATLEPIPTVAERAGIPAHALIPYGSYKAKVDVRRMTGTDTRSKLVLVSAMSPTPAGEGKPTTTVGLADAFSLQRHRTMVPLREPALGPSMGIKGGATGGGHAQVVPMEDINLHFTGDFHAIQIANNTLAALIDNHIHQGNELGIDPRRIQWKRVVDVNDRALREAVIGLGGPTQGTPRQDGFDIVVASEIMAILCLATDLADLERRIGAIVVGFTYDRSPVSVADLGVAGAITLLLK